MKHIITLCMLFVTLCVTAQQKKEIDPCEIGAKVTDLTMNDLQGKEVNLKDFVGHGKYVLVDFWASWCGPCRAELPNVKAVYDKYKDKKFDIVGVSLDVKQENWENAVKTLELPWHQMSDLKGWDSQAAEKYRVNAIPFTILFNPKGKIVATDLRGKALADKMKEIMGF